MKVTGPAEPPAPPAPEDAAGAAEAEGGAPFADRLGGAGTAPGAGPTDAAAQAAGAGPTEAAAQAAETAGATPPGRVTVSDLAADLQAGRLTRDGAVEKLVERVIAQQLGAEAPPAVREKLRAALADALEGDPLLAEKLKALG